MSKKRLITVCLFFVALLQCHAGMAGTDTVYVRYAANEEWYIQLQGGIDYLAADNSRYLRFTDVISPEMTMSLGKRITPIWGGRFQALWGKERGAYFAHDQNSPLYSLIHTGAMGIISFNITEFVGRGHHIQYHKKFNLSALAGTGLLYTNFLSETDETNRSVLSKYNSVYWAFHVGVEANYRFSSYWDINAELSSSWMSKHYNGQTSGSWLKADGLIHLLVGVRYTFNPSKRRKGYDSRNLSDFSETNGLSPSANQGNSQGSHLNRTEIMNSDSNHPSSDSQFYQRKEVYYSVEDLLEMAQNNEPLEGKQLSPEERVRFGHNNSIINPMEYFYLDKMVALLKMTNIKIVIKGGIRKKSDNRLTEQRMKTVRDYLMNRGISRSRFTYQYIQEESGTFTNHDSIEFGILW